MKKYIIIASFIVLLSSCWETMQERKQKAAEYAHLAFEAAQKSNYEEALFYNNEAIKLDDKNPLAYSNRGYDKDLLGDTAGAIEDYKKAFALDNTFEEPLYNLGSLYGEHHKIFEAKVLFLQVIKINPNRLLGYYGLGALLYATQQYDSAIKYLKLVIEKYPIAIQQKEREDISRSNFGNTEIMVRTYYYIGLCYKHIGDIEKAKYYLYLVARKNIPEAIDSLKTITNDDLETLKNKYYGK